MSHPPSQTPLSVVIITKNEASRIEDCLKSVLWAAEIVVVDDYSDDETCEIAKRYTPRVIQRRMEVEGRHRNAAYQMAAQPWVLSLDADERVTPELRSEIQALFQNAPPCNGYTIPRKNFVGKTWVRHGGMYPSAQLRLFRKDAFRYEEEAEIHPRAFMQDPRGALTQPLLHYTYRDFTDAVGKLDRQTDLEAKKWAREKRRVGLLAVLRKMISRFWKAYVSKQGYKDGVIGLFLAVHGSMYQFVTYAKYWEIQKNLADKPLPETVGPPAGPS